MTTLLPNVQPVTCKERLIRKPFYIGMGTQAINAGWSVPITLDLVNYFGVGVKQGAISFNLEGVSNNVEILPGGIAGIIIDNSRWPLVGNMSTVTVFPDNNTAIPAPESRIIISAVFTSVAHFTMYLTCDAGHDLRNFSYQVTPLNFRPDPVLMVF